MHPRRAFLITLLLAASAAPASAADLTDAARQAFADYLTRARQSFLERQSQPPWGSEDRARLRDGAIAAQPGNGDGIQNVSDGLIHHWRGAAFIPDVTLEQTLSVSRNYHDYPSIFHPVVAATIVSDATNALRVKFRMRESAGGMTAVLDIVSNIQYTRVDPTHAHVISTSDDIREVKDIGRPSERLLPAGHDSGYLWRSATFTRFVEADGGVYMSMETVALSREYPPLLGWVIEPIARRIGRRSVAGSVEEFRTAMQARH